MAEPITFRHQGFNVAIRYDDPDSALTDSRLLAKAIDAALARIGQSVVLRGTIDVVVVAEDTYSGRIVGGPGDMAVTGALFDGRQVVGTAFLAEALSGIDRAPDRAEIRIAVPTRADYLDDFWFDADASGVVAAGKFDLVSALVHEVLHAMGVSGYRDAYSGQFIGGYATVFDTLVQVYDGDAWFAGAAVTDLLGGPLALESGSGEGIYHLDDDNAEDIINGSGFARGHSYALSQLDLAILQDLGWQLRADGTVEPGRKIWQADTPGASVQVAGTGTVLGSSAAQEIWVGDMAGTITFDPSFNRGGDTIHLSGTTDDWRISRTGSSVLFDDGDTRISIPVGLKAATVVFDDGERSLAFDASAGGATLGGHLVDAGPYSSSPVLPLEPSAAQFIHAPDSLLMPIVEAPGSALTVFG